MLLSSATSRIALCYRRNREIKTSSKPLSFHPVDLTGFLVGVKLEKQNRPVTTIKFSGTVSDIMTCGKQVPSVPSCDICDMLVCSSLNMGLRLFSHLVGFCA
uniref:Uncharacterized protein n=1 Tax=Strigamia maritima TaxID=126957 RepID=T1IHN4_STRMM